MTEKSKPKTAAERQAAYRRRMKYGDNDFSKQMNIMMSLFAQNNLKVLAAHFGITQQKALEQALEVAAFKALEHLSHQDRLAYRQRLLGHDDAVTSSHSDQLELLGPTSK